MVLNSPYREPTLETSITKLGSEIPIGRHHFNNIQPPLDFSQLESWVQKR